MHNLQKDKRNILMRTSHDLKWENKIYVLKRSIVQNFVTFVLTWSNVVIRVAFFTQPYRLFNFLGTTGHPADLDPELLSALQNVSEVVCRFVDNNPTAWAPLICEVKYSSYDYIACPFAALHTTITILDTIIELCRMKSF